MSDTIPAAGPVVEPAPIPMRLTCPRCGLLHVDRGVFATKPHHTHSCQGCGETWRPAVVHTVGVQFLPGFKDEPDVVAEYLAAQPKARQLVERLAALGYTDQALGYLLGVVERRNVPRVEDRSSVG